MKENHQSSWKKKTAEVQGRAALVLCQVDERIKTHSVKGLNYQPG